MLTMLLYCLKFESKITRLNRSPKPTLDWWYCIFPNMFHRGIMFRSMFQNMSIFYLSISKIVKCWIFHVTSKQISQCDQFTLSLFYVLRISFFKLQIVICFRYHLIQIYHFICWYFKKWWNGPSLFQQFWRPDYLP